MKRQTINAMFAGALATLMMLFVAGIVLAFVPSHSVGLFGGLVLFTILGALNGVVTVSIVNSIGKK